MSGVQELWSLTPGSNQTADPEVNWREGQAPSSVNDAARQMMAKVKAYALDTSGSLVTGGTSTAYTATTNEGITSLTDGLTLAVRAHATNAGTSTLNVDGVGAKPWRKAPSVEFAAGEIVLGRIYRATYVAATTEFVGLAAAGVEGVLSAPTGTRMAFQQASAPTGWTKESNATFNDAAIRLVTGSPTTGGTVGFTTAFAQKGITGTVQSHALTESEMPAHKHQATHSTIAVSVGGGTVIADIQTTGLPSSFFTTTTGGSNGHSHGFTGGSIDLRVKFAELIIATKN